MIEVRTKPYAFVIMPFAESFSHVYESIIKPAVEICGIDCVRADEDSQGHIHSQMLHRIYESEVVIADITGLNPNVFYELGVAHSCGSKTVVICETSELSRVPFDIAPYRVFSYEFRERDREIRFQETINKLVGEILNILSDQTTGIPNPVQDYLASQSPIHSSQSLYIDELDSGTEEQLLQSAQQEIVYYGITANAFSDLMISIIESRMTSTPLDIQLCLLDPNASDCWDFIYHLREGKPLERSQLDDYREEDLFTQRRAIRRLGIISDHLDEISLRVGYYSKPPVFWAYLVDGQRLAVGHLAAVRLSSRNMPVSILVKSDRTTQRLYSYYQGILETVKFAE